MLKFSDPGKGDTYLSDLVSCLKTSPIPTNDLATNLALYMPSYSVRRFLYLSDLYRQITSVPGYVADFGTRYGHNLVLFRQLWHILEPANITRAFFGFDTFQGLTPPQPQDGSASCAQEGYYPVPEQFPTHLREVLALHEAAAAGVSPPMTRAFLVEGDTTKTFKQFIEKNPHAVFALVYFDFDLYEPTRECLKLLAPRLTKGSIVAFDELIVSEFPGETIALLETFELPGIRLRRYPYGHCWTYFVVE